MIGKDSGQAKNESLLEKKALGTIFRCTAKFVKFCEVMASGSKRCTLKEV